MSKLHFIAVPAIVFMGLVSALASPLAMPTVDYSGLPPAPPAVHKQLADAKISLAQAIEIAQKHVQGLAKAAVSRLDAVPPTIEVDVWAAATAHKLTINAENGEVIANLTTDGQWTETASGLKYFDIIVGQGPQPSSPNAQVTVHYTGWLIDGKKFDSSIDRGQPATFMLSGVIKGWTEGVATMKVGGKRRLIIPYHLAYGENGNSRIPAKSTLVFEVELLDTK